MPSLTQPINHDGDGDFVHVYDWDAYIYDMVHASLDFTGAPNVKLKGTLEGQTGVAISQILDEDDMASNSAVSLVTQQSLVSYVAAQITLEDLDTAGDTGTGSVDLDSEVLTIAGTTNQVSTVASNQSITLSLPQDIHTGASPTFNDLTISSPSNIYALSHDSFASRTHDGDTLQLDGINSDGGAFSFATSGLLSFTNEIMALSTLYLDDNNFLIFNTANDITMRANTGGASDVLEITAPSINYKSGGSDVIDLGSTITVHRNTTFSSFATFSNKITASLLTPSQSVWTNSLKELVSVDTDLIYGRRELYNGSFRETFDALVTSDGATITMSLEQSGGGDLTMQFSDGDTTLDCTPVCTIALTAGSDASPQANYVYIPQSTKVLTKSTSSFPDGTEHIKVGYFLVPSATYVQSDGCYINQNWNDHLSGTDNQGHLLHMAERIRRDGAYYFSGIDPNGTDQAAASSYFDYVGAAESYFSSSAGVIYQMHRHAIDAKDTGAGDDVHVVNWNGDNYHDLHNLADIVADSTGTSLGNKYFNLFFFVVGNKTGEYAPMMCNLPSGGYASAASAQNDVDGYDNLTMPREFGLDSSTGVPICRMTLRWIGGTSTLNHVSTLNLRGGNVSASGGGTGSTVSFADNQFEVYNVSDVTKLINLDASAITTGNTRTITMADRNVDLDSPTFTNVTDSGISQNQVVFGGPSGLLSGEADFTYNTATNTLYVGTNVQSNSMDVLNEGALKFNDTTGNYISFAATEMVADLSFTLPTSDAAGPLVSNGSGVLSFTASPTYTGLNLSGLTASQAVFTDGSKNLVSNAITGTGSVVLAASPTLTGTISGAAMTLSGVATLNNLTASQAMFTNASKEVVSNAITGTGNVVMSTSPTLTGTLTVAAANFSGIVNCDNTTDSSSISTGSIICDGGVGIAKKAYIGDDLIFGKELRCVASINLGTGYADVTTSRASPDNIGGYHEVIVTPSGSSDETYTLTGMTDKTYYLIHNDDSNIAAVIDAGASSTAINIPALESRLVYYNSALTNGPLKVAGAL